MVTEELYFVRAAKLPRIEPSPLSRTIKDLKYDLGMQLHHHLIRTPAGFVRPASLPSFEGFPQTR